MFEEREKVGLMEAMGTQTVGYFIHFEKKKKKHRFFS